LSRHCPNPDCSGLVRDGRVAEYVDRMTDCIDCGAQLVAGAPPTESEPGLEYNDLRTVFIANSVVQGHLVASVLEAAGIPVYIKGEMLQGAVGELAADVSQVEVQVPVERSDLARELVSCFEGPEDRSPLALSVDSLDWHSGSMERDS
jgi:hypothetical protein